MRQSQSEPERNTPSSEFESPLIKWAKVRAEMVGGDQSPQDLSTEEPGFILRDDLTYEEVYKNCEHFFSEEVKVLTKEQILERFKEIFPQLIHFEIDVIYFRFSMPKTVSAEELESGQSAHAKVYWALFEFAKTNEYISSANIREIVGELRSSIDQNPQMVGPKAMWQIAKDMLWQPEIDFRAKQGLLDSMTYALSFFDQEEDYKEIQKKLDLENSENYAQTSHLLEAIKEFWTAGEESYARDGRRVSHFFVRVLENLKITPKANLLLSLRARQLKSMLEKSEDFPLEVREKVLFEISKGIYASNNNQEGIRIVPEEDKERALTLVEKFKSLEEASLPPQWMVDEALERGDRWLTWQPSREFVRVRSKVFNEMHSLATIPVSELIGNGIKSVKQQEIFDYQHLVSKPMRKIIQDEFGIDLRTLSLKEQLHFLNYLKHTTIENSNRIKEFVGTHGVNGMRTFLSLESETEDFGDKIIIFAETNSDIAASIFSYYSTILDSADNAFSLLQKVLKKKHTTSEELSKHTESLRNKIQERANKMLKDAIVNNRIDTILNDLKNISDETVGVGTVYTELLSAGLVEGVSDIEKIKSNCYSGSGVLQSVDVLHGIESLYKENYSPEVANSHIETLHEKLKEPGAEVHTIHFDNKLLASVLIVVGSERTYVGALNKTVDPELKSIPLGTQMIKEVVESKAAAGETLEATATLDNSIGYINRYGFSAYKIISDSPLKFGLIRNDGWIKKAKQISRAEIVGGQPADTEAIQIIEVDRQNPKPFDLPTGKIITRIEPKGDTLYLVCEDSFL